MEISLVAVCIWPALFRQERQAVGNRLQAGLSVSPERARTGIS